MKFFMEMVPPTATAQEKSVRVIKGRPVFFEPARLKAAKQMLIKHLTDNSPDKPLEGALALKTLWLFPRGKTHKSGEWRTTRPDTDNLQKMLKDCMTKTGYWKDDAQVVLEMAGKIWSDDPTGILIEILQIEGSEE